MFAQQKRARALSLDNDIEEITSLPGAPLKRIRTDPPAHSGEEIELSSSDELADEEEEPVPEQVEELVDEGLRLCLVPTIHQRGGVGQGKGQEDGKIVASVINHTPRSHENVWGTAELWVTPSQSMPILRSKLGIAHATSTSVGCVVEFDDIGLEERDDENSARRVHSATGGQRMYVTNLTEDAKLVKSRVDFHSLQSNGLACRWTAVWDGVLSKWIWDSALRDGIPAPPWLGDVFHLEVVTVEYKEPVDSGDDDDEENSRTDQQQQEFDINGMGREEDFEEDSMLDLIENIRQLET
ncbi:hypothetical protein B0H10DRAFT_1968720 [Mycena sp. CBHHK59/15]|nr:hypothetical protein B0H10DRAFT_1968720 [Mycena sp. CBHHK59/15]